MAHLDTYTKARKPSSETANFPLPQKTSKFYSHFLYKALLATVFLLVIQNFPSQAPEFMNQTVLPGSWELLHLLFVGVAVCYGLFSRRNDEEPEKENGSKFDNAQSYVSRLLQVSSFFDDEVETSSGSDDNYNNSNKIQTWNSQYFRGEPPVVVAQESSRLDENRGFSSRIVDKPLLLPVRSLKSRVVDSGTVEYDNNGVNGRGSGSMSMSNSSSNLGSKRFSKKFGKSRSLELRGEEKLDFQENVVLPSPIPWRSRSGRMEMKEELDGPGMYALPNSVEEVGSRSFRSQSSVGSSRPHSTSSSPKSLSPSSSMSVESQATNAEDLVRRKSFNKPASHPPPPAPPLPPPPMTRRSPLMNSSSSRTNGKMSSEKEFKRSITSEPKDLNRSERGEILRRENSAIEAKSKAHIDGSLVGKSVRTNRVSDSLVGNRTARESESGNNGKVENTWMEFETSEVVVAKRKSVTFDEKLIHESLDIQEEDGKVFEDVVTVETDYDSESEDESNEEAVKAAVASDAGPDVDRKADEFIAKFREQIRLQRIESIKRSSRQINRNFSR